MLGICFPNPQRRVLALLNTAQAIDIAREWVDNYALLLSTAQGNPQLEAKVSGHKRLDGAQEAGRWAEPPNR